jgi:hypothetical protein
MNSQTPIRKKRKKIKTLKIRGTLVRGAPKDEDDRFLWENLGYKQLPDGRWYNPLPVRGFSTEFIREYPHGHNCKACKTLFRSKKYHDGYCSSCRAIMERKTHELKKILDGIDGSTPELQATVLYRVLTALECPLCEWQSNEGRHRPESVILIREYLNDWVVASHLHWMKHIFWNRLPFKTKFVSKTAWEQHKAERELYESLAEHLRKNPPIIEVPESEQPN